MVNKYGNTNTISQLIRYTFKVINGPRLAHPELLDFRALLLVQLVQLLRDSQANLKQTFKQQLILCYVHTFI